MCFKRRFRVNGYRLLLCFWRALGSINSICFHFTPSFCCTLTDCFNSIKQEKRREKRGRRVVSTYGGFYVGFRVLTASPPRPPCAAPGFEEIVCSSTGRMKYYPARPQGASLAHRFFCAICVDRLLRAFGTLPSRPLAEPV